MTALVAQLKQLKACDCMQAGQPPSPVTLQVGEGTPIDLTPVLQNLGTSLRSAVQSAFSSATSTPTPAAASTAAAAPASAGGPAAISPAASSASPATGQTATEAAQSRTAAPGSQTNTQSGSTPPSAQAAPLNFFLMQQVVRSLLMAVTPFIGTQAGAGLPAPRGEPSTGAAHPSPAASGGAPVAGHAGIRNMTPADLERLLTDSLNHERRSQQAAAAADSNPASSSGPAQPSNPASSRGPEQPSNAPAPPASAAPSGQVPSSSALEASHAAVTQASLPTQQGAEAASGSGSVLPASPSDPADSSTVPSATDPSATEPSATDPSAGGPSAGEASRSATSAGDSKGKRPALPSRAAGLGSGGLPPREKLDKTSRKGSAKSSTDKGKFLRVMCT